MNTFLNGFWVGFLLGAVVVIFMLKWATDDEN